MAESLQLYYNTENSHPNIHEIPTPLCLLAENSLSEYVLQLKRVCAATNIQYTPLNWVAFERLCFDQSSILMNGRWKKQFITKPAL